MPRSFDDRRPLPADVRRSLRGPKRTGPIGTIVPGDHVEVARDIQRLWEYVRRRDVDTDDDSGLGGGGGGATSDGYASRILDIGSLIGWWRLGETPAWPIPSGSFLDTSGYTDLVNLSVLDNTGGNAGQRPTLGAAGPAKMGSNDDGCVAFNFDRVNGRTSAAGGVDGGVRLDGGVGTGHYAERAFGAGQALSAACWLKPKQSGGTGADEGPWPYWGVVFAGLGQSAGDTFASWKFEVEQYTGQLRFVFYNDVQGEFGSISPPANLAFDTWVHACVTLDVATATLRLYLNGARVATVTGLPSTHSLDVSAVAVGGAPRKAGLITYEASFYGSVDECCIFGKTLTPSEVVTLYATGADSDTSGWHSGTVDPGDIVDGTITPAKLETGDPSTVLVTDASSVVGWSKIKGAMIDALAVVTAAIADAAVTTAKLADSAVTTVKIAAGAVTTAKIADANVTTAKIADGNVTGPKIAGYPADGSKALFGDGSWAIPPPTPPVRQLEAVWSGEVPAAPANCQVWHVPYVEGAALTFTLSRATLRVETPGSTSNVVVVIESSASGGAFSPTTLVTLTLAPGDYEVYDDTLVSTVHSGDLLRARFSGVDADATDFTIQLEGSE